MLNKAGRSVDGLDTLFPILLLACALLAGCGSSTVKEQCEELGKSGVWQVSLVFDSKVGASDCDPCPSLLSRVVTLPAQSPATSSSKLWENCTIVCEDQCEFSYEFSYDDHAASANAGALHCGTLSWDLPPLEKMDCDLHWRGGDCACGYKATWSKGS